MFLMAETSLDESSYDVRGVRKSIYSGLGKNKEQLA